ncbi:MAG TPA: hypothetical protein VHE12_04165 [bacterium]|nr:hypothetical protein [bacterium]
MKLIRRIVQEAVVFLKRCWFLVMLLVLALLAYPVERGSEFWVWTSLSYVTSFIFYVLTIYLPQRRDQKNIHRVIVPYLQKVINDTRSVSYSFLAASGHASDIQGMREDDFHEIFKKVKPLEGSTRLDFLGFSNWTEYLIHQKGRVVQALDRVLSYEHYLETDFILQVETLQNCGLFEIIDRIEKNPVEHEDLSFLTQAYYECYLQVRALETALQRYMADV